MIFNSTSIDLNLNTGVLSKAVLEAAGPSIQNEVSQQSPGGPQGGQYVISSGGNLPCQCIFHAVLRQWDDNQGTAGQVGTAFKVRLILLIKSL